MNTVCKMQSLLKFQKWKITWTIQQYRSTWIQNLSCNIQEFSLESIPCSTIPLMSCVSTSLRLTMRLVKERQTAMNRRNSLPNYLKSIIHWRFSVASLILLPLIRSSWRESVLPIWRPHSVSSWSLPQNILRMSESNTRMPSRTRAFNRQ